MKSYIIDTETTNAEENAEIIEAAWIDLDGGEYCERFRPEGPIAFGAMATHHIMPHNLVGCRPSSEFALPPADYIIAHNVDFDARVMGSTAKRICTLALSRYLWPELDSHKQAAVLYFLFGAEAQEICRNAHCALDDVRGCQMLFQACVCELALRGVCCDTMEDIWQASEVARVPTVMTFGMHKGKALTDVPASYVRWLLGQPDVDPYLRRALEGA